MIFPTPLRLADLQNTVTLVSRHGALSGLLERTMRRFEMAAVAGCFL
jgi:hypothetical protein